VTIDLALAIPLAIVCVLGSAFCSGTEVALFSIRRIDREQLGKAFADRRIRAMLERPRQLIATVLVGNEAFNGVLAVVAYVVLTGWFEPRDAFWLALAATVLLIVLVAEITAKTLAAKTPLGWSRLCVLPLAGLAVIALPLRLVVQGLVGLVLKPFGVAPRPRSTRDLSEEEFRTLVDAGSAQGQVDARERRLIHRVFEFNDKNVGQVMTPRERIFALSYDLPVQRLVKELAARGFSRVPIYQKSPDNLQSLDNIRGILNAKDLVRTMAGQPLGRPLGELLHEPLFVPRTTPVKRLFLTFKQKKVHMAIVVSEYGKVLGLVTMDDLLSQIFGVLRDERAALQSSVPPGRAAGRGAPGHKPDADGSGPNAVPTARDTNEASVPLAVHPDEATGPTQMPPAQSASRSQSLRVLDPPPRPIHDDDEVTPPATDIADLIHEQGKP
jgi:CBS domain containing-hemolysin-like protein